MSPWLIAAMAVSGQQQFFPPKTLTLEQVWQQTEKNSKVVQIQQLHVEGSVEEIKDARAERLPEITASGAYARVSNMPVYDEGLLHAPAQFPVLHTYYTLGAEAYLNVYGGGRTNIKIAEKEVLGKIAREQKLLTISEVKLRAAEYYLGIEQNLIFSDLMRQFISDQEKQLERIRQLQKNGVVLKSDVLRAELQISRYRLSLDQIGNDITLASQKLDILIGQPDSQAIIPGGLPNPDSLVFGVLHDYLDEAVMNAHPERLSGQEKLLKQLQLEEAKAAQKPGLGLFATYNYSYPQILFYPYSGALYGFGMAGVKASWTISNLYQNKHKIKAAEIEVVQQEIGHRNTWDQVRQQVTAAYLRYKEALNRITVARANEEQATENARIVNNTYFNQLSLVTDLLDANTQQLQTRFELAAARMAALLQYYQLQNSIGNL